MTFPQFRPGQHRVALEEMTAAVVAAYAETSCLIWSNEHSAWWRQDSAGYTTFHPAAGRYTIAAAYAATRHCDPDKGIMFERVDGVVDSPRTDVSAPFQRRVAPWLDATFGPEISGDREERNHRFLEEAIELVQANGCSASEAHQLVDYVFGRPVGEPRQEVGGVMVTLAALCLASGLDMHKAAETELTRVWTKVEAIRAKQAAKPKHSPLPEQTALPVTTGEAMIYDVHLPSMTARFRIPAGLPFAAGMYGLRYLRSPSSDDISRWAHLAAPPVEAESEDGS